MADTTYRYIILGAGTAGGSAVRGIREVDAEGNILLLGAEKSLPYSRPSLTKKLWFDQERLQDIFLRSEDEYAGLGVDVRLDATATELDVAGKRISDDRGHIYSYETLLLATGATPRRLTMAGGDTPGLVYYRAIPDYLACRAVTDAGATSVVVIGGGFIGSEMAAALHQAGMEVSLIYPEAALVASVLPATLGTFLADDYRRRGMHVYAEDAPRGIRREDDRYVVETVNGKHLTAQLVVLGVGVTPNAELAQAAGLRVHNGVVVNQFLQTDDPHIYAAGDVANFPYTAIGRQVRVEHWDNAIAQGRHVGRAMAGDRQPYEYMPYFFSDLFDFGYEAVGDVHTGLDVVEDWTVPLQTGTIYYCHEGHVRGVMLCNTWGKLDEARDLIRAPRTFTPDQLKGRIRPDKAA